MRWQDMRGSDNVEDRENASPARGGLGGGLKLGGVGLVAVVAISMFLGLNPLDVLNSLGGGANGPTVSTQPAAPVPHPGSPVRDENKEFVARMLFLERKRSERSGRGFVLVLLESTRLLKAGNDNDALDKVMRALSHDTRDTDVKGW